MAYKCRICGANTVDNQGDICELCAIGQDPYAPALPNMQPSSAKPTEGNGTAAGSDYTPKRSVSRKVLLNGGASLNNTDPYGNDMASPTQTASVQVYPAGQTPQPTAVTPAKAMPAAYAAPTVGNQPTTSGIAKSISVDNRKKSILPKWFRALFCGIPFTLDDDITTFQVFPDYSGTSLNALGNACDQVIVYGRINPGAVSENNDVEVYGRRDANNNIIAKTIKNKASGAIVAPQRSMGIGGVWAITLLVLSLVVAAVMAIGIPGIIACIVLLLLFVILVCALRRRRRRRWYR